MCIFVRFISTKVSFVCLFVLLLSVAIISTSPPFLLNDQTEKIRKLIKAMKAYPKDIL